MKKSRTGFFLFLGLCYAFLYLPLFFIILFSFNDSGSLGVWSHFSFVWYKQALSNTDLWSALLNSLKIAMTTATLSVFVGLLCAFFSVRVRRSHFLDTFSVMPLVVPEVVIGLAFLTFFVTAEYAVGLPRGRGLSTVVVAHTTLSLAYVVMMLRSRLLELDVHLEEAALDLGARPGKVFLFIILPSLSPTLLAAWVLSFTLSLDDLVIASFTSGLSSTTLPVLIFSHIKTGLTPQINALCSLIVLSVLVFTPLAGWWFYKAFKKEA
jgi:putrescine transport system permease protein